MESQEIKLADGRYLIYFTFADETAATQPAAESRQAEEPEAQKGEGESV
jgi:hypothetical protein